MDLPSRHPDIRSAPTGSRGEWERFALGVAIGLVFGAIATLATRVELDGPRVMTVCGAGFVATWSLTTAARLVFICASTHVPAVHDKVGELMFSHQVAASALAPSSCSGR